MQPLLAWKRRQKKGGGCGDMRFIDVHKLSRTVTERCHAFWMTFWYFKYSLLDCASSNSPHSMSARRTALFWWLWRILAWRIWMGKPLGEIKCIQNHAKSLEVRRVIQACKVVWNERRQSGLGYTGPNLKSTPDLKYTLSQPPSQPWNRLSSGEAWTLNLMGPFVRAVGKRCVS